VADVLNRAVANRVRHLRLERGMSQAHLARVCGLSGSYVSLIESGRRPVTERSLNALAARLDCTVEYLRTGQGGPPVGASAEPEIELRFAEVALKAGEARTARRRFAEARSLARERGLPRSEWQALWGLSRACEALDDMEQAIEGYEALLADASHVGFAEQVVVQTALCRCYSECGDLAHAIDVGERALTVAEQRADWNLAQPVIELASTLVGCYYARGDLTKAQGLAARTVARADAGGSPQARGAALWNAALVAEARGDLSEAMAHLDRSLALYGEGGNRRGLAMLRTAYAWMLLRAEDPDIEQATALLRGSFEELSVVGTDLDLAYVECEQARCLLIRGELAAAETTALSALARLSSGPRRETARTRAVLADVYRRTGRLDQAIGQLRTAAIALTEADAGREAAVAWRELAEALLAAGSTEEAVAAFRSAADAAGAASRPPTVRQLVSVTTDSTPADPTSR
jgi:transcriptional regulator with XRE-family HTH domain